MSATRAMPFPNQSKRITTATTTTVKAGTGVLVGILVGTTAVGTIAVQDGAGNVLAQLKASIPEGWYPMGFECPTGIKIVTAAASDITVVYL